MSFDTVKKKKRVRILRQKGVIRKQMYTHTVSEKTALTPFLLPSKAIKM